MFHCLSFWWFGIGSPHSRFVYPFLCKNPQAIFWVFSPEVRHRHCCSSSWMVVWRLILPLEWKFRRHRDHQLLLHHLSHALLIHVRTIRCMHMGWWELDYVNNVIVSRLMGLWHLVWWSFTKSSDLAGMERILSAPKKKLKRKNTSGIEKTYPQGRSKEQSSAPTTKTKLASTWIP